MDTERRRILGSDAHVRFVDGEPGSGKTYLGCQIAYHELACGKVGANQQVLFLTFARNAVARIRETYVDQRRKRLHERTTVELDVAVDRLRIETLCGFCWWVVECYGRYRPGGTSKRPWLIGANRIDGIEPPEDHEAFTYGDIQQAALEALRIAPVRDLISSFWPLIIVDETQDLSEQLFDVVAELGRHSRLVLLFGGGQSLYRTMQSADPEQILKRCRSIAEWGVQEFRIVPLLGKSRFGDKPHLTHLSKVYEGEGCLEPRAVLPLRFKAVTHDDRAWRLPTAAKDCCKDMIQYLRKAAVSRPSLCVLSSTNRGCADIHRWVSELPYSSTLSVPDDVMLCYGRVILEFLRYHKRNHSPQTEPDIAALASALEALALAHRSGGRHEPKARNTDWAPLANKLVEVSQGQRIVTGVSPQENLLTNLEKLGGWLQMTQNELRKKGFPQAARWTPFDQDDNPLQRELWRCFIEATDVAWSDERIVLNLAIRAFDQHMQRRILFEKLGLRPQVEVMTIHKVKGREFDGVILVLERDQGAFWKRRDLASRDEVTDLYRVAVTRARHAFTLVAHQDAATEAADPVLRLLPHSLFPRNARLPSAGNP